MLELIVAVVIVILVSHLCSLSEAALFTVSINKVRPLAESGNKSAQTLLKIKENMGRTIATIVIINNISNISGSVMIGYLAGKTLGDDWLGLFSGCLTFVIILCAELLPKIIGERFASTIAFWTARPMGLLTFLFTPATLMLEILTGPITKGDAGPSTSEDEIRSLVQMGKQEGVIEGDEGTLITRVFHLNDRTAKDLMTPRSVISYLEGYKKLKDVKEEIIDSPHSRIVIIQGSLDEVSGVALKDRLLSGLIEDGERLVEEFQHEAVFVMEQRPSDDLLRIFRQTRQHLAIVFDEHNRVTGVVTLEDVMEVLFGKIMDETDETVDMQKLAKELAQDRLKRASASSHSGNYKAQPFQPAQPDQTEEKTERKESEADA